MTTTAVPFADADDAYQYLCGQTTAPIFDHQTGLVIRSGMEGMGAEDWRLWNAAADLVDAQRRAETGQ